MEELLRSLGIEPTEDAEGLVRKLEQKQSEIMERLDNVEDERRRQKLENDLNQIAGAITVFSWMRGKVQTGAARYENTESDDFSDLKNQAQENNQDQMKQSKEDKREKQLYDKAIAAMKESDDARGVEMMRSLAESGYAPAQCQMGDMYFEGKGVPEDYKKAAEWYRKAADQGHAKAQYHLGFMYYYGEGVPKDDEKYLEWLRKAANQGYEWAEYYLARNYEKGEGVPRDDGKAEEWYQKAVSHGLYEAKIRLRIMSKKRMQRHSRGVTKDDRE